MRTAVALLFVSLLPCSAQQPFQRRATDYTKRLAPYVPSPQQIVDRMLELSSLHPGETLYDLGCGDGRILITAAQKFKAKAVGVELNDDLVKSTTDTIKRLNLQDLIM